MARRSLESQRPIMAPSINSSKRTSKRYSTYSASPSFATTNTANSLPSADTGMAEIRHLTQGLDRLENKHLQQQRFVPSQKKTDDLSKLSLGAKVERALGRRMTDQDAVLRVKRPNLIAQKSIPISSFMDEKVLLKA